MQHLGYSRSARRQDHLFLTPDTFVRAPLPGLKSGMAITHISPAAGAAFVQYTVEFDANGRLDPTNTQRFVYVLEGALSIGDARLSAGQYSYVPSGLDRGLQSSTGARAVLIEKGYQPLTGVEPPVMFTGDEQDVPATALLGDSSIQVRSLIPAIPSFDFAVNTMTYDPGAALPMVEIHVMEHGLLMLDGGGIYRLGDAWYPVGAGDFIWMAPYCPQWFGALGKTPARYLIYKNWNRHPLTAA